jgi:hypothetical protein
MIMLQRLISILVLGYLWIESPYHKMQGQFVLPFLTVIAGIILIVILMVYVRITTMRHPVLLMKNVVQPVILMVYVRITTME